MAATSKKNNKIKLLICPENKIKLKIKKKIKVIISNLIKKERR